MSDTAQGQGSRSLWSVVTGSEPAERAALGLSFLFFFFVLSSYYLLRPLRDQFSAAVGSTNLWPFWLATFVVTLALTPVFGALVARHPRERFIPVVYGFFILGLIAFVPAFRAQDQLGARNLGIVFYVWVSVFNLFAVSLFWSFMADLFDSLQSRRLFPVIALGGTVGSIAGPIIAGILPVEQLLFCSMAMLVGAIGCALSLSRWSRQNPNAERRLSGQDAVIGGAWWAGLRQLATSPFLRQMVALTLLSETVGTIAYALNADYAGAHFPDRESRKTFYAHVDLMTNSLVIALQGFGIARLVLTRFGSAAGLVLPSLINTCVLLAVAFVGDSAVVAMLVITRAGAYGLYKPASDAIYTRVDREARYKGKNAIDTVVWRLGDVLVSVSMKLLAPLAISVSGYALVSAGCAALSGWFGWRAPKSADLAPEERVGAPARSSA
ncbi:MFS transporter [soil metagenome]